MKRYLDLFPRENIWIGLFDDLEETPMEFTQSVFRYLGVDDSFVPVLRGRPNASGEPRSLSLQRMVDRQNPIRSLARSLVPKTLRKPIRLALTKQNLQRVDMPGDVEAELRAFFRPDVERLEQLIDLDLSAWKG